MRVKQCERMGFKELQTFNRILLVKIEGNQGSNGVMHVIGKS